VLYNEVGTQNSISGSMDIVNLLTFLWITSSNWEAKKLIQWGWIYINEQKIEDITHTVSVSDWVILFRKGKQRRIMRIN
jgi:tyrosyl-tRNA synthetase